MSCQSVCEFLLLWAAYAAKKIIKFKDFVNKKILGKKKLWEKIGSNKLNKENKWINCQKMLKKYER